MDNHKRKEALFLLKKWFDKNHRTFPWREDKSPYKVLVSEMMLQQTRANTVIPYFEAWIKRFPDFASLAKASEEEVIKAWEGLGYYSRARRLHSMAKEIMSRYGGRLPEDEKLLSSMKGIGPYMIGALLSFAFFQKKPAVDGNVMRVISRLFAISSEIESSQTKRFIQEKATELVEESPFLDTAESLIELGALVCQKKPKCEICPIASFCQANKESMATLLPIKKKREKTIKLYRDIFILEWRDHWLIRREKKGLMRDLYHFHYHDAEDFDLLHKQREDFLFRWEKKIKSIEELPKTSQFFTKYACTLFPLHLNLSEKLEMEEYIWVPKKEILQYPFSSGPRKIIDRFL